MRRCVASLKKWKVLLPRKPESMKRITHKLILKIHYSLTISSCLRKGYNRCEPTKLDPKDLRLLFLVDITFLGGRRSLTQLLTLVDYGDVDSWSFKPLST